MQVLSRSQAFSRFRPRRGRGRSAGLGALVAVAALAVAAGPAGAAPSVGAPPTPAPKLCSFRVVHNDRIGAAVFPAGTYNLVLEDERLDCKRGAELFAEFLESFNGVLPSPWRVSAEGSGKASFLRGTRPGFSVELNGRTSEEGKTPFLGQVCPTPFTVTETTVIRPLRFTKGKFLINIPAGSGITCNRAAVLFTRFLGAGGTLLPPWKLTSQTATFYKPSNPTRSAFRIEPLNGAGRR